MRKTSHTTLEVEYFITELRRMSTFNSRYHCRNQVIRMQFDFVIHTSNFNHLERCIARQIEYVFEPLPYNNPCENQRYGHKVLALVVINEYCNLINLQSLNFQSHQVGHICTKCLGLLVIIHVTSSSASRKLTS